MNEPTLLYFIVGAVFGLALFFVVVEVVNRFKTQKPAAHIPQPPFHPVEASDGTTRALTEEEAARVAEERRRLAEEQEAFRNLMGFNQNIVYGLDKALEYSKKE